MLINYSTLRGPSRVLEIIWAGLIHVIVGLDSGIAGQFKAISPEQLAVGKPIVCFHAQIGLYEFFLKYVKLVDILDSELRCVDVKLWENAKLSQGGNNERGRGEHRITSVIQIVPVVLFWHSH